MAYLNTGIERCKTLRIDKKDSGVSLPGYPKDYSILNAFTANGNSYGTLTETQFQQLFLADYTSRLADFKIYVQQAEGVASIDAITELGYAAYRTNTTSCPIGQ